MTATQEEIAAAWSAWQSRHGGKIGPGPAFVEAINAALAIRLPTLESLQRENAELRHRLKAPEPDLTCPHIDKLVETGELSIEAIHELYHIRDINSMLRYGLWHEKSRAEAAEAEVKRMRDRYECWMPVTETPPAGMHPDALLHFYCSSDEVDGEESPEYWKTDTWQDKPGDAVYWCAIVSPLGPHERTFIAHAALASTGGEHHAE